MDPIPTWLLKECVTELVPLISDIVNKSLAESHVPESFKMALVRPLLKKPNLDQDNLKNYRPVSNLPFISKITEKVVNARLTGYLTENNLATKLQSAYTPCHSTETALLKVHSDILESMDHGKIMLLVMLDLSAAFDTIDHQILLTRLEAYYGLTGDALNWMSSYLRQRKQVVVTDGQRSSTQVLQYGVPQGSVLGPKLYTLYTKPLADIINQHGLQYHFYADDTQIYTSFDPSDPSSRCAAINAMEDCIKDVKIWMGRNALKLNDDKTEFIIFGSKPNLSKISHVHLDVGNTRIEPSDTVKNLGVTMDSTLSMRNHISKISKTSVGKLRNIGHIRRYLTKGATTSMVVSSVTSPMDYCNSLLYGLPEKDIAKLQMIQNMAAKIIDRKPKYAHVTPILKQLHWLPVKGRIDYRILLYAYKALNEQAPSYMEDMLHRYVPTRDLRSADAADLVKRTSKTRTYGNRSFSSAAPILWNSLPISLKQSPSVPSFKRNLKSHIFSQYYK